MPKSMILVEVFNVKSDRIEYRRIAPCVEAGEEWVESFFKKNPKTIIAPEDNGCEGYIYNPKYTLYYKFTNIATV